ncbi:hypothetical protein FRC03_010137 [Tulasnella sp. 419]|nr:hypothetical protein FRC03_010137 [Tulasnella sp. 419]
MLSFLTDPTLFPLISLILFTGYILSMARVFPDHQSQKNFPVASLIGAVSMTFASQYVRWNLDGYEDYSFSLSMVFLYIACVNLFASIFSSVAKEDTIESEALGWLILQATQEYTRKEALSCVASISNSPQRRKALWGCLPQILTSLISTTINDSGPGDLVMLSGMDMPVGNSDKTDQQTQLMFYLACLAEAVQGEFEELCYARSRMAVWLKRKYSSSPYISRYFSLHSGPYFSHNLPHHFPRNVPSRLPWHPKFSFSFRYPGGSIRLPWDTTVFRQQFPFLEELESHLEMISMHKNPSLRIIAESISYQLHLVTSRTPPSAPNTRSIPSLINQPDVFVRQARLAHIRMLTAHYIDTVGSSGSPNPSLRRHLSRHCIVSLELWITNQKPDSGNILGATLDLIYLIMMHDLHHTVLTISSSGSVPLKLSRCIGALTDGVKAASSDDDQLLRAFTNPVFAATVHYLKLLEGNTGSHYGVTKLKDSGVIKEIQGLYSALLLLVKPKLQGFPMNHIALAIMTLHALEHIVPTPKLSLTQASILIELLISQGMDVDRVAAMNIMSHILNQFNNRTEAWSLAIAPPDVTRTSIPQIISSMAEEANPKYRSAAFTAILDTHIFYPSTDNFRENTSSNPPLEQYGSGPTQDIPLTMLATQNTHFQTLYEDLTKEPSPLLQVLEGFTGLDRENHEVVTKSVTIIFHVVKSRPSSLTLQAFFVSVDLMRASAGIASCEVPELVSVETRIAAIHLFALLLGHVDPDGGQAEQQTIDPDYLESTERNELHEQIVAGVRSVVNTGGHIGVECAEAWVERLTSYRRRALLDPVLLTDLINVFREAVLWTDMGESQEYHRKDLLGMLMKPEENV